MQYIDAAQLQRVCIATLSMLACQLPAAVRLAVH